MAVPVSDTETEWAEYYKVSVLKLLERPHPGDIPPTPDGGVAPPLEAYREHGHFRLQRQTCRSEAAVNKEKCLCAPETAPTGREPSGSPKK